jgi:serine phosphatase RsbU (regulator of sigma subunit)
MTEGFFRLDRPTASSKAPAGASHGDTFGEMTGPAALISGDPGLATGESRALDELAAAAASLAAGAPLDEALATLARAVGLGTTAGLALVRLAEPRHGALVARAVWTHSPVLGAELEGARLPLEQAPAAETAYDAAEAPEAVRLAAAASGTRHVVVLPVGTGRRIRATLELYRDIDPFSEREQAIARLAASHLALVLELTAAMGERGRAGAGRKSALDAAGEALAAGADEAEAAEQVVRLAATSTDAARGILWRVEPDGTLALLAARGLPREEAAGRDGDATLARALERGDAASEDALVLALGEPPAALLRLEWDGRRPAGTRRQLAGFSARAGVALRRARRAGLVELALERSQTIVAVVGQAIARLSLSHTLETAVERISEFAAGHVAIYLREGERLAAAASQGLSGPHTVLAERLLDLALGPSRSRGYFFVADLRRDPRLGGLDEILAETGLRRALVVPLVVHEEVTGVLAVFRTRPGPLQPGEEELLLALSGQLAVAVQNARLHERATRLGSVLESALAAERRAARQLRGLFEITHSFTRSLSLEATLDAVAGTMVELFDLDAAVIRMPDPRGSILVPLAVSVADTALHVPAATVLSRPQPIDDPVAAEVIATRRPVLLGPRTPDPLLAPFLAKGASAAVLPLATPGEVIGTLTLLSLDPDRQLDAETVETASTVTAQAALAIDNARLYQQQKDFSETMQRSLLPRELPAVEGIEIGHVYQSSSRMDVGGDVYDLLRLDDGRLAVCLGDVTGKGIEAAADMALAKFTFRALARSSANASTFLARVNEVVADEIALGKFITMLYAVVDLERGELEAANAGHPPLRLVRPDGTVEAVTSPGLALGIEAGEHYEAARIPLAPGTTIVLYTDGVIEARHDGELYGEERLDAFLAANSGLGAQALADALVEDCRTFGGGALDDDCAVVCLRVTG